MRKYSGIEIDVNYGYEGKHIKRNLLFKEVEVSRKDTIENKSGIYMLFSEDNELLYIGESKVLKDRISHHVRGEGASERFSSLIKSINVCYLNVSKYERVLVEGILVINLEPIYNVNEDVEDIEATSIIGNTNNKQYEYFIDGSYYATAITKEMFFEIRELHEAGKTSRKDIVDRYGVSSTTAGNIFNLNNKIYQIWEEERLATV